jgi:hypothetical protein
MLAQRLGIASPCRHRSPIPGSSVLDAVRFISDMDAPVINISLSAFLVICMITNCLSCSN